MNRNHTSHRRETVVGSRWVQTVSYYRITTVYLIVALLVFVLLLVT